MAGKTISMAEETYRKATANMPGNYNEGMKVFFGQDVSSSSPARNYGAIMKPELAAKWAKRLKQKFGVG